MLLFVLKFLKTCFKLRFFFFFFSEAPTELYKRECSNLTKIYLQNEETHIKYNRLRKDDLQQQKKEMGSRLLLKLLASDTLPRGKKKKKKKKKPTITLCYCLF
eukprot:TRINITY_DN6897_c0_g1_i2.p1 TRINITY_DN6897_c0_g1~~TRINITY_DN6897_c0_g1_i2.p1  ORF type:complete len:103 (-),score=11.37 TRINITY_DN6897_c0_g1_i2:11-319(-)